MEQMEARLSHFHRGANPAKLFQQKHGNRVFETSGDLKIAAACVGEMNV